MLADIERAGQPATVAIFMGAWSQRWLPRPVSREFGPLPTLAVPRVWRRLAQQCGGRATARLALQRVGVRCGAQRRNRVAQGGPRGDSQLRVDAVEVAADGARR